MIQEIKLTPEQLKQLCEGPLKSNIDFYNRYCSGPRPLKDVFWVDESSEFDYSQIEARIASQMFPHKKPTLWDKIRNWWWNRRRSKSEPFEVHGVVTGRFVSDKPFTREVDRFHPACYTPNDDPYPLCKGGVDKHCKICNLYEDMEGPY